MASLRGESDAKAERQKAAATRPLTHSESSSSSDDDEHTSDLAREMAHAAHALRRKNPHAELGRATAPRAHPLARRQPTAHSAGAVDGAGASAQSSGTAAGTDGFPRGRKVDLFGDDEDSSSNSNSSSSEAEAEADLGKRSARAPSAHSGEDRKAGERPGHDRARNDALQINQSYATRFEEVKRKQELQRLTEKYGKKLESVKKRQTKGTRGGSDEDDSSGLDSHTDSSDGEPEDDDAVLLTEEKELAFAEALLAVRKAAAAAANKTAREEEEEAYLKQRYFPPAEEQIKQNSEIFEHALRQKKKAKKPFTLKDEYQRAVESTAAAVADDGEPDDGEPDNGSGLRKLKPQSAEERALRKAFLASVADSADTFDVTRKTSAPARGGADAEAGDIPHTAAMEQRRRALLEEAFRVPASGKDSRSRTTNTATTTGPTSTEEEVFIRDFFVHELWRGSGSGSGSDGDDEDGGSDGTGRVKYAKSLAALAQAEEDEAFYHNADVWEREYQEKKYRHEEAAEAAHIQTFPRPIGEAAGGLLRKTDTSRKDARQRRAERLEAARRQQVEELKRLKHLKRQEIDEQRALIAAVAGMTKAMKGSARKTHSGASAAEGAEKPTWSDEDDEDDAVQRLKAVWSDKDLEAPFDPDEFDKKMAQLFDDAYYKEENVDDDEMAYMEAELDTVADGAGVEGGGDVVAASSANDDDDDDDDDDGAEEEEGAEVAKGKAVKTSSTSSRAKFAALAAEPDLYKATSLEEARQLAQHTKAGGEVAGARTRTQGKNNTSTGASLTEEDESLVFPDPFGLGKGTAAGAPTTVSDEDVAMLYPSAALHHIEEATFRTRQELDRLLAERGAPSAAADDNDEDGEALLRRLQAELKRKEEEYDHLHHDRTIGGGAVKMRFRYREVEPEDFTLSVEEILARDDRQLNMIAPMNCYAAYLDPASNQRDRQRIARRRAKGFRELDTDRTSRRYGEVARTVLLNPEEVTEEEGAAIAERLRKRLREEGGDPARVTHARVDDAVRGRGAAGGGARPLRGGFDRGGYSRGGDRGGRGRGRGGWGAGPRGQSRPPAGGRGRGY